MMTDIEYDNFVKSWLNKALRRKHIKISFADHNKVQVLKREIRPTENTEKLVLLNKTLCFMYLRKIQNPIDKSKLEAYMSTDPKWSTKYASEILKGRFQLGEVTILKSRYRGHYVDFLRSKNISL
jgi:hypothetical protein